MNPELIRPSIEADAELDLLLQTHLASPEEHLTPSSGFALSVMESIHQQATEPSPIAFPWRRVVPGIAGILCALAAFVHFAARATTPRVQLPPSSFTSAELILCSILLAACISIVAVAASFRLAGRSR